MPTVTFLSEPKNAKISVTPIDIFIATCFSDSRVICDKETLHPYLVDKTVSKNWWDLTDVQRKTLGMKIIRDFAPIPHARGHGDCDCVGTNITWCSLICGHCAQIVSTKLDRHARYPTGWYTCCYYALDYIPGPAGGPINIHCYGEEEYHLPCYRVWNTNPESDYFHAFNALQIGRDEKDFDNWIFFDCFGLRLALDLKAGSWELHRGESIEIRRQVDKLRIAFHIPSSGKPICNEGWHD